MSWSYGSDPTNSAIDEVRFLVGDTDPAVPLIQDEEIAYLLTVNTGGSPRYVAAAAVAESIAASCAKKMDKSVGGLSISWSMRYEQYKDLAERLRTQSKSAAFSNVGPAELLGGGEKFLGPTDTPLSYNLEE